jgi:glycosyltransferase involved in cell wall biosynthesis
MRIAQVAPLAEAVPPKLYGGTERVVSWLTEELVAQGNDVTLFASGDSKTSAKLVPCAPEGLRLRGISDFTASHLVMLDQVRRRAGEFDIIHLHVDVLPFPVFRDLSHQCLVTLHGRLDLPDFRPIYEAFPSMPLVSISNAQRAPMPAHTNWLATVHHGLPPAVYQFNEKGATISPFWAASRLRSGPIARLRSRRKPECVSGSRLRLTQWTRDISGRRSPPS